MGVLDDASKTVTAVNFPPTSIDNTKSAILKENSETTITENYSYFPGISFLQPKDCSTLIPKVILR